MHQVFRSAWSELFENGGREWKSSQKRSKEPS